MKKILWLVPAIVAGLVLSVPKESVQAQECTLTTITAYEGEIAIGGQSGSVRARATAVAIDNSENIIFSTSPRSERYIFSGIFRMSTDGSVEPFSSAYLPTTGSTVGAHNASDLAFDRDGNLFFTTSGGLGKISESGILTFPAHGTDLIAVDVDASGNAYFSDRPEGGPPFAYSGYRIHRRAPDGTLSIVAEGLNKINRLALDSSGNIYALEYAEDRPDSPLIVRKILPDGTSTIVAGNRESTALGDGGPAVEASLGNYSAWFGGIEVDNEGNIYIADGNYRVRKVSPDGIIATFAGNGIQDWEGEADNNVPATEARLGVVNDIALDSQGNLYIADSRHMLAASRIRKVTCPHEADLSVSLEARVLRGRLNFTSIVNNDGPEVATNVVLVNNLPSDFSMVESYPVGMCSGTTTVTCNLGNMDVGQIRRITISTVAPLKGPRRKVTDRVRVSSEEISDPNMANNRASVTRFVP